jgi:hypothetical protein
MIGGQERDKLKAHASRMPLAELARLVLFGSYIPGVHDDVLLERCKQMDELQAFCQLIMGKGGA